MRIGRKRAGVGKTGPRPLPATAAAAGRGGHPAASRRGPRLADLDALVAAPVITLGVTLIAGARAGAGAPRTYCDSEPDQKDVTSM